MHIKQQPIDNLTPYANNARTHSDEQVAQIAASIQEFGFNNPVLVDSNNSIIAGHGRVLAARILELDKVPTIKLDHMSEAQRKAYILADNKLALNAGWDQGLLAIELEAMADAGFDVNLTGFSIEELDGIFGDKRKGDAGEDDVPDPQPIALTELGDVWQLGKHRLICADSLDSETYNALMGDDVADMVWTDPPYNIDYHSTDGKSIENDNMEVGAFENFLSTAFAMARGYTEPGAAIYIAHSEAFSTSFRKAAAQSGWSIRQCLIWVKHHFTLSRQDYQWQHEPILYGWNPDGSHRWHGGFSHSTVFDDEIDLTKLKKEDLVKLMQDMRSEMTVLRENKPGKSPLHPTMKPVELVSRMMLNSSAYNQIVLDPFGGSGTTLIACEKHRRRCRTIELDPVYADVIVNRWQDYTGDSAILESTGQTYEDRLNDKAPRRHRSNAN